MLSSYTHKEKYMLTSTQRAHLRSMAQNITPIFQIGKNGIGDNQIIDSRFARTHQNIRASQRRNGRKNRFERYLRTHRCRTCHGNRQQSCYIQTLVARRRGTYRILTISHRITPFLISDSTFGTAKPQFRVFQDKRTVRRFARKISRNTNITA